MLMINFAQTTQVLRGGSYMRSGASTPAGHSLPGLQAREHTFGRPRTRENIGSRSRGRDNRRRPGPRSSWDGRLHGAGSHRQREVHLLSGLVQLWVSPVRDDRGPGAVQGAQGEGQEGRSGPKSQGRSGEVFSQVHRGGQDRLSVVTEEESQEPARMQVRQVRCQGGQIARLLSVSKLEEGRGWHVGTAFRTRREFTCSPFLDYLCHFDKSVESSQ